MQGFFIDVGFYCNHYFSMLIEFHGTTMSSMHLSVALKVEKLDFTFLLFEAGIEMCY